jgi:hypothetical protein
LIQATATRWGLSSAARDELLPHLKDSTAVLHRWLSGQNPFKADFLGKGSLVLVEQAFALSAKRARRIGGPTPEEHVYEELQEGEVAGTADLIIVPSVRARGVPLLVVDHKTGQEDFSEPLKKPQLISLARAASLTFGMPSRGVVVGVLHARRRGLPSVYADEVPIKTLAEHSRRMFLQVARIGDGTMRPGPWCIGERCPTIGICPARDAELLEKAGNGLSSLN